MPFVCVCVVVVVMLCFYQSIRINDSNGLIKAYHKGWMKKQWMDVNAIHGWRLQKNEGGSVFMAIITSSLIRECDKTEVRSIIFALGFR